MFDLLVLLALSMTGSKQRFIVIPAADEDGEED